MTRLDGKITDLYYWGKRIIEKADDYLIENSKVHFYNMTIM